MEFNNSFKQRYLISGIVSEYRYFFKYGFFSGGRWRLNLENLIFFFLFLFLVLPTFLIFFYFVKKNTPIPLVPLSIHVLCSL